MSAPVLAGSRYAFAATVDGNATNGDAGQRALLYLYPEDVASRNKSKAFEGSEAWYRSALYFPADFRPAPKTAWNWVVEWHNWPNSVCCANLALSVDTDPDRGAGERLALRVMGGGNSSYPVERYRVDRGQNPAGHNEWYVGDQSLDRGRWYDLVFHVKWSSDPARGLVEWWLDGRQIVSRQTSTLFWYADNNENFSGATPGPGQAYYMEGYYRPATLPTGATDTTTQTVYHDGTKIGPTRSSTD